MSDKNLTWKNQCRNKVRHHDRDAALGHIASLKRQFGNVKGLGVYRCQFCKKWHVGRSDEWGRFAD